MHRELEDLMVELKLTGKAKNFCDIEKFLKHIFEALDNKGYHSEYYYPGLHNLIVSKQLGHGAYWGYWGDKHIGSSFFPKDWNGKRVFEECLYAFENKYSNKKYIGIYGKSKSGLFITFDIDYDGNIIYAYPCKNQDDECFEKINLSSK